MINGSNARTYEMLLDGSDGRAAPAMWQIGTDGGYLDHPVRIERLLLMPGERADLIIDFAGFAGRTLTLRNVARAPYPNGEPPDERTVGRILQFRVQDGAVRDSSFNPATGGALRSTPLVRLVNHAKGTLAAGVTVRKIRLLTLNEVLSADGMPLKLLLNNTDWDGKSSSGSGRADFTRVSHKGMDEYLSEVSNEGDTELWEIVNLTADAHPIHTHLTQVQLMNRQEFDLDEYQRVYEAAFAGGNFEPASGPPLHYTTGNRRAVGGNPDIGPYLKGPVKPPRPNEAGWKDTVVTYPREVMRMVVRFAPTSKAVDAPDLWYPFSPEDEEGRSYVWHCHIIDHEDNEMMRPVIVRAKPGAVRSFVKGRDY